MRLSARTSTWTPSGTSRSMFPNGVNASITISRELIVAWRRSSLIEPVHERNSLCAGTTQAPERLTSPIPRSFAFSGAAASVTPGAGRSAVRGSRSPRITALAATSIRSVSSSIVRRPSAAASRSCSMTASRSASEARTSITCNSTSRWRSWLEERHSSTWCRRRTSWRRTRVVGRTTPPARSVGSSRTSTTWAACPMTGSAPGCGRSSRRTACALDTVGGDDQADDARAGRPRRGRRRDLPLLHAARRARLRSRPRRRSRRCRRMSTSCTSGRSGS